MSARAPSPDTVPATGTPAAALDRRRWLRSLAWRFVAWSLPLYGLWAFGVRGAYLEALGRSFAWFARRLGSRVHFVDVRGDEIRFALGDITWGDRFGATGVSLVALAALGLATCIVPWRRRLRALAIALPLLFVVHVLALWPDLLHVQWHETPGRAAVANGLRAFATGFGTFLFPLLFWIALAGEALTRGKR